MARGYGGGRPPSIRPEWLPEIDRLLIPKTNGTMGFTVRPKTIAWKFGVSERTLIRARRRKGPYAIYPLKD
jgi:hypothetical protein